MAPATKKTHKTTTEIQVIQQGNDISSVISVIERLASSPDLDPMKMEKILEMQERLFAKRGEISFNEAMARLQPILPTIEHDAKIVHKDKVGKETLISTYARYETIDAKIRKLYTAEGFSVSFNSRKNPNGTTTYSALLSHKDGHSRSAEVDLPADTGGAKNAVQAVASTVSYAKRYLLCMLFNIVTSGTDDDGNSAGAPRNEKGGNKSRFEELAENESKPGNTIDGTAERSDDSQPQDMGYWDGQSIFTSPGKGVKKQFDNVLGGYNYLKKIISNHATKQARIELVTLNLPLVQTLKKEGHDDLIKALHDLADQGTTEPAGEVNHG